MRSGRRTRKGTSLSLADDEMPLWARPVLFAELIDGMTPEELKQRKIEQLREENDAWWVFFLLFFIQLFKKLLKTKKEDSYFATFHDKTKVVGEGNAVHLSSTFQHGLILAHLPHLSHSESLPTSMLHHVRPLFVPPVRGESQQGHSTDLPFLLRGRRGGEVVRGGGGARH